MLTKFILIFVTPCKRPNHLLLPLFLSLIYSFSLVFHTPNLIYFRI